MISQRNVECGLLAVLAAITISASLARTPATNRATAARHAIHAAASFPSRVPALDLAWRKEAVLLRSAVAATPTCLDDDQLISCLSIYGPFGQIKACVAGLAANPVAGHESPEADNASASSGDDDSMASTQDERPLA